MNRLLAILVTALVAVVPMGTAQARTPACRCAWVAAEGADQMVKVDIDAERVIARRAVAGAPHNLTVSPSGRTIATTLWRERKIVLRRGGAQTTLELGGAPHDVKIARGRIVVANQTEARLDLVSDEGRFRRSIGLKADPHDLALRRGGWQAWVTLEGTDDLAVVSLRRSKVRYVSTGKAPHDLLFAPDGKLWVTDWAGAVHVLSRRGRLIKTIPLGVEAHHLDFTPDGRQAWITDGGAKRVYVVRTSNYSVRKRFSFRGTPHHIAITPDGDRAVVADNERGLVIVYNVNKLRRAGRMRVGTGPHGIWSLPSPHRTAGREAARNGIQGTATSFEEGLRTAS